MGSLKFREVPQPLSLRIEIAKNSEGLEPNCYGTAFFLLGVMPYDMVIFTSNRKADIRKALSRMSVLEQPQDNSLVISFNKTDEPEHASFIEKTNPLRGYQRKGSGGRFAEISQMSDIDAYFNRVLGLRGQNFHHRFYTLKQDDDLSDWVKEIVGKYEYGWWA